MVQAIEIGIKPTSWVHEQSTVSHNADLSKVYTNHSIRSTATTFLHRSNFTLKQIMSVTGHRSINSLAVYEKVSENEKLHMGLAMSYFLQNDEPPQIQAAPAQFRPIAPKPVVIPAALGAPPKEKNQNVSEPTSKEIVQYEPEDPLLQESFQDELNFDVEAVLQDIEKQLVSLTQTENSSTTSMTYQRETIKKSPNIPIFNNCKIGNIANLHIHIHKK